MAYGPLKYAFVAQAHEQGFGYVVPEQCPRGIVQAVETLRSCPALRQSLVDASGGMVELLDSQMISRRITSDIWIHSPDGLDMKCICGRAKGIT